MKARRTGQVIVALLAWALFGYHWYLVTQRRFGSSTLEALQLLLTLVLVIWAVTTLWVHHNRWHFANRPERRIRCVWSAPRLRAAATRERAWRW